MSDTKIPAEGLRSFFEQFQRLRGRRDVEKLVDMYGSRVMIAGPSGSQVIAASDLLGAIPKREQLLTDAGHRETALVGFEEIELTPRYSLVRTEWQWMFEPAAGDQTTVTLPSAFVVDRTANPPCIIAYILHDDVTAVLKRRGLLASSTS
jgi:hypothetical protein